MKPSLAIYDVLAAITPGGLARRTNTLRHKTFKSIYDHFDDHAKWRWVIVTKYGDEKILIADLWMTSTSLRFPYIEATFVEASLPTLDAAIGYVALHLC